MTRYLTTPPHSSLLRIFGTIRIITGSFFKNLFLCIGAFERVFLLSCVFHGNLNNFSSVSDVPWKVNELSFRLLEKKLEKKASLSGFFLLSSKTKSWINFFIFIRHIKRERVCERGAIFCARWWFIRWYIYFHLHLRCVLLILSTFLLLPGVLYGWLWLSVAHNCLENEASPVLPTSVNVLWKICISFAGWITACQLFQDEGVR